MSCRKLMRGIQSFFLCLAVGLTWIAMSPVAYAVNSANWWTDIAQDRAADVQVMLAQGADPNELGKQGQPAIMWAIRHGAWKVYDVLLASPKTELNVVNVSGETPLMYLAIVGQTKKAQSLIKRGAHVNRLGWTPLQYAASKGRLDMVKLLIADKAIINAPSPDGTSALMMAAYAGSEPVVQVLLDAGADVAMQNLKGQNAADWARLGKHDALAKKIQVLIDNKLRKRAAMQARDAAGMPAVAEPVDVGPDAADTGANSPDVKTIDLEKQAPPPAANGGAAAGHAAKKATPNGSSSRYFDLDRFNK